MVKGPGKHVRRQAQGTVAPSMRAQRVLHQSVSTRVQTSFSAATAAPQPNSIPLALVPPEVVRVAERFKEAGRDLFLVGGFARDAAMGGDPKDFDATTDARPTEVKRLLSEAVGGAPLWTVGEKYGTIGAVLGDGVDVEVTTYRSERYDPGSRKPEVEFGDSLEADLGRRDFTFNAMAVRPDTGEVIDPYGGSQDLERGVVRAVGDPEERIKEDPLRMLRAVRFASRYGFRIDDDLASAVRRNAALLDGISRERVRDEVGKILVSRRPSLGIRQLADLGLLERSLPEVARTKGVMQQGPHHGGLDVFDHTMNVLDASPSNETLRLAALMHDTGKPEARAERTEPDGSLRATFHGHEDYSAEHARKALNRLKYPSDTVRAVSHLCSQHMKPLALYNHYRDEGEDGKQGGWSDKSIRRFVRSSHLPGEQGGPSLVDADDLLALNRADVLGHAVDDHDPQVRRMDALRSRVDAVRREAQAGGGPSVEAAGSPIDGKDLMQEFGGRPGRWIGEVKAHLTDMVVDGDLAPDDRESALAHARKFLEK